MTENAFEVAIAELDQRDQQLGACVGPVIVNKRRNYSTGKVFDNTYVVFDHSRNVTLALICLNENYLGLKQEFDMFS